MAIGRDGMLTAWLAALGRVIAEVGAIIIVGGNIRGLHPLRDDRDRA